MNPNFVRLPSGAILNLAHITNAEIATWREAATNGDIYLRTGVTVRFVGGSGLRLINADAEHVRELLGMN